MSTRVCYGAKAGLLLHKVGKYQTEGRGGAGDKEKENRRFMDSFFFFLTYGSGSIRNQDSRYAGDVGSIWVRKIPLRRAWQPTSLFLLGVSPWRSLVGYHP